MARTNPPLAWFLVIAFALHDLFLRNIGGIQRKETETSIGITAILKDHDGFNETHFDESTWPALKERLCPKMVPDITLGPALFAVARDHIDLVTTASETDRDVFLEFYDWSCPNVRMFETSNGTIAYFRLMKVGNNQLTAYFERQLDKNFGRYYTSSWEQVQQDACMVTAVRDPVSHFLSAYNEVEFRSLVRKSIAYWNETRRFGPNAFRRGSTRRFEQFVAETVFGTTSRKERLPFHNLHVKSMSGLLSAMSKHQLRLTAYLPSIHNLSNTWPKFLSNNCPFSPELAHTPMELDGQHLSSRDEHGFYRAAKQVWHDQGPTARALCAIHAMDYACWELPDGIPPLCKELYATEQFVKRITQSA